MENNIILNIFVLDDKYNSLWKSIYLRVADPRTLRGCGDPRTLFLKRVRGVAPPTNFSQIAFGAGRPAKIGEGSMRQNEGFECRNRLAARTGSQPALRCAPDGTVLWLQCRAGRIQKTSLYAHPGLSYIAAGHH
jgi:hypothetical protein